MHFRHEFFRTAGPAFAHVFHGFADGVIHPQRLPDFGEQRGIVGQVIHENVNLLLQRQAWKLARPRLSPQP